MVPDGDHRLDKVILAVSGINISSLNILFCFF